VVVVEVEVVVEVVVEFLRASGPGCAVTGWGLPVSPAVPGPGRGVVEGG
jgi:hypothetical protein